MNPNAYPDITAYQKVLAEKVWSTLADTLSSEQLETIACLEPKCDDSAEAYNRKWMALVTVSTVLVIRAEIGAEQVTEILEDLDACSC